MRIYIWYPILVSMALGFTFMNIPPVNRQFMEMMGVGYDGLSWFLSGLFWSHAFGQIPAGLIADRTNAWKTLVVGLLICLLANILPFINPQSVTLATALRFFLGAGTSLTFLATVKILLILAPSDKLVAVQGWQGAGFSLGLLLPYLTLPHLGEEAWPYAYILAVVLLAVSLATAFLLPRSRMEPSQPARPAAELKMTLKDLVTSKPIWFLGIFHGLSYGSLNNLGSWLPSIMADLDGLGDPAAWASAAVVVLFLGTFGRAFGGMFLSRFYRSQAVNGAVLIICILYLAMGLAGSRYMLLGSAMLMALACGATYGGVFTLSASVGGLYAATAMGVMNMIGNLFNIFLTLIFGYVRQYTGQFGPSLLAAGILGLLCWFIGRQAVARADRDRTI